MITAFNDLAADTYSVGQNIMIITLHVPDLWISAKEETSEPYTYVDDATFVDSILTTGSVRVGHYVLSALETQKVDLTDYVKNTDYATPSKAGIVRSSAAQGIAIYNGLMIIEPSTACSASTDIGICLIKTLLASIFVFLC